MPDEVFKRICWSARRALVLGDGDGRFLRRLLDASPELHADYVDRSQKMLEITQRRVGNDRVKFHCSDVLRDALPMANTTL